MVIFDARNHDDTNDSATLPKRSHRFVLFFKEQSPKAFDGLPSSMPSSSLDIEMLDDCT